MTVATHDAAVDRQFSPRAQAYLTSTVHAQGEDLAQLAAIAAAHPNAKVLDLGCGGGHVSFAVAPRVSEVVAYDLSPQMLAVVAGAAAERGLANLRTCQGKAESLPFADGEFDLVLCRFSAHHWQDVPQALREARRVLKPGGAAAFVDVVSPGHPLLDTWMQAIEVLRDTSHVRDYAMSEWLHMLADAGFVTQSTTLRRLPLEFTSWVTRMQTPDVLVQALRNLMSIASEPVRRHFEIQTDGSFTSDSAALVAVNPAV
jgi:ubiquinone/menaquinone biosynthesis C-methylase UbiE